MKAYQIKISLMDTEPLVWRRVIVPAEITFRRLHDVIQLSMGWLNEHLYAFNLEKDKLRITNDLESVKAYKYYSTMKITEENDPCGFLRGMIERQSKDSQKVRMDKYLNKYKSLDYVYDFGDDWVHKVDLEAVIDNYEYTYPTCVDGSESCPLENIGGVSGHSAFRTIYLDTNDPDHEDAVEWASSLNYLPTFDLDSVNETMAQMLKLKRAKKAG